MKLIIISLISIFVFSTSCKKSGCTNTLATNYSSENKKDDGSCVFEGSSVFWIDANTSITLSNIGQLKIYVDDKFIGKMSTNSNFLKAPDCNTGGITYFEDLGANESKIINYKAKYDSPTGQNTTKEVILYEGSLKLIGGKCQPFQLQ